MALIFHRVSTIPLWAIALFAIALAAQPSPRPFLAIALGIATLASTMMAMLRWRRTRPVLVACTSVRTIVPETTSLSAPDDALDLVRMDDDGGWQMTREPNAH